MLRVAAEMAKADLLQLVRDRKALLILLLMPLVLTTVLSFSLGNVFGGKAVLPFSTAVYNGDVGQDGRRLVRALSAAGPMVHVVTADSAQSARADVAGGKAAVAVVIPPNFSKRVNAQQSARVLVDASINNDIKSQIVQGIVDAFGQRIGELNYATGQGESPELAASVTTSTVKIQAHEAGMHPITAGSYYAIGMIVMFLLNTAVSRASAIVQERNSDLYKRLQASPVSRLSLTMGHWLSQLVVLFAHGLLMLIGVKYILNLYVGPMDQMLLVLFAFAIALSGLTVFLGNLVRSARLMDGIGGIGTQVVSVLGGSIYPLYIFPALFRDTGRLLPNGQALQAMVDSVTGVGFDVLLGPVVYLLLFGACLGAIAVFRYARPAS